MGEILTSGKKRNYYTLSGKDKCIYTKKEGEKVKIPGLSGYVNDIQIKKIIDSQGEPGHEWIITLVDDKEVNEETEYNQLSFKEGTYTAERIWNQLLSMMLPEVITIFVYASERIKNSPGVSIQVNGKTLSFAFGEWDEKAGGYKGIPSGDAKSDARVNFWRDKVFKDIFLNLLGREWDGVFLIHPDVEGGATPTPTGTEPTFSLPAQQALSKIKAQLKGYEEKGDWESLANAWGKMLPFLKENSSPGDEPLQEQALLAVQTVIDRISDTNIKLLIDGSWEKEELPF